MFAPIDVEIGRHPSERIVRIQFRPPSTNFIARVSSIGIGTKHSTPLLILLYPYSIFYTMMSFAQVAKRQAVSVARSQIANRGESRLLHRQVQ